MTTKIAKGNLTRTAIKQAILRIENGKPRIVDKNRKLSVAAVAEEANTSNANIHNNYSDLADIIRAKNNKATRTKHSQKQEELKLERQKNRDLRNEIIRLEADLVKSTSINARLTIENRELKSILNSSNITRIKGLKQ